MMKRNGLDEEKSEEEEEPQSAIIFKGKDQYFPGKDYLNLYEKDFEMPGKVNEGPLFSSRNHFR